MDKTWYPRFLARTNASYTVRVSLPYKLRSNSEIVVDITTWLMFI